MPSGGQTPLSAQNEETWDYVRGVFREALKNGLHYEWLDFFLGGLLRNGPGAQISGQQVKQEANDAAIEWDF